MAGVGTLCNVVGIVAGGAAGLVFSRFFNEGLRKLMLTVCGLSLFLMGLTGAMQEMLTVENGAISVHGSMTVLLSLALGALAGCTADLDRRVGQFGQWLRRKAGCENDEGFAGGFIKASLVVCIGAMAILGPINERFYSDHSILLVKSLIDFVTIMILTVPYGKGCLFAAIPVGICQGTVTAASGLIQPIMTSQALSNLSMVGSVIILATGINLIWDKDIKVANLTPALFVAVALAFL